MKVLIIDRQPLAKEGLKRVMSETFGQVHFAEAEDPEKAIKLIRQRKWDLIILDFPFPTSRGLELLKEIREANSKAPVLTLGNYPEELSAKWALRAGATGFISKNAPVEELATALRKVIAGRRYLSPELAERLTWNLVKDSPMAPHEKLSQRELEVLRMIAQGKTVTDIANELALSVKTISSYRARILEKMEMRTTADLIRYALQNRLVD
jgi:two-component system, NarL family, invasion response regulator UvrY